MERFSSPHRQLRKPITSSHLSGRPISRVTSSQDIPALVLSKFSWVILLQPGGTNTRIIGSRRVIQADPLTAWSDWQMIQKRLACPKRSLITLEKGD